MPMFEALGAGLVAVLKVETLSLMLLGIALGFVVGILPGLGGGVALALMLPFTFGMQPVQAFAFLLGMVAVVATTGDITSVLFGVPGEASSAAVILDGHQMAKGGEAGRALGAALMSSLVGALVGAVTLAISVPIVRPLVLSFASPEFFALSLLGITFIATLSGRNRAKGIVAGAIGLVLSMVGLHQLSGVQRYTFGQLGLWEGVGLIPVVVGLFAIPEIVELWVKGSSISGQSIGRIGGVWQGCKDTFVHLALTIRCSMIGTFIGFLPGLGGSSAQWLAYGHAVQSSRNKSRFGEGDVRGVLGPGAANNSSLGGALIPTIAFGIPDSVGMAILLGALIIQGLVPGPPMLNEHLNLTLSFVWIIVLSNVITVGVCLLFLQQLARVTAVRGSVLIPAILLLIFLGSFTSSNSVLSIGITLAFGLIGLLMVSLHWPRPPLIVGLVLGALIEKNLFISYERYGVAFLQRPLVLVIVAIGLAVICGPTVLRKLRGQSADGERTILPDRGLDLLFSAGIVLLLAWVVWEARGWPLRVKLFPWTIGIPALLAAVTQLWFAVQAQRVVSEVPSESQVAALAGGVVGPDPANRDLVALSASTPDIADSGERKRFFTISIWIIAFAIAIWLLGFKIGAPLAAFAFLYFGAHEQKLTSSVYALSTYLAFLIVFDLALAIPFPPGLIAESLSMQSFDSYLVDPVKLFVMDRLDGA
jgi:putative tricarboxylic transport membrane protein